MHDHDIRTAFQAMRERGLRAKEAAESAGLSEGAAIAAHCGAHEAPLQAISLKPDWLGLLQSLQACGPLMALTRNESVVHEKTGVYQKVSASGPVGLALGEQIDLRLFFNQWHAGFAVAEALKSSPGMARPACSSSIATAWPCTRSMCANRPTWPPGSA